MRTIVSSRCYAVSVGAAVALLAGCGGSQPPIGAPAVMPQNRATVTKADRSGSWILPGARNKDPRTTYKISGPLLYATNQFNSTNWDGVTIYQADAKDPAPLAKISDGLELPFGECIDGEGTLYVTNAPASDGWVSEYPLGKTTPSGMTQTALVRQAGARSMRKETCGLATPAQRHRVSQGLKETACRDHEGPRVPGWNRNRSFG